jgi:hypothetical protein
MLPRLSAALGFAFLAALAALCGCSSSQRRDQSFGTDAGANYQIPDAANFPSAAGADASTADAADDTGLEDVLADVSAQDSDPGTDS